jgi:hypothetical protein
VVFGAHLPRKADETQCFRTQVHHSLVAPLPIFVLSAVKIFPMKEFTSLNKKKKKKKDVYAPYP